MTAISLADLPLAPAPKTGGPDLLTMLKADDEVPPKTEPVLGGDSDAADGASGDSTSQPVSLELPQTKEPSAAPKPVPKEET